MFHCRVFSQQVHCFVLSKMSSRVSHEGKIFVRVKCVDVRLFHCIVSRLATCHSPDFSPRILEILNRCTGFGLSKMSLRESHAWKISLLEKCVDVRLLSISCTLLPLHDLAFSDESQSRFQYLDLGNSQQVHSFALS